MPLFPRRPRSSTGWVQSALEAVFGAGTTPTSSNVVAAKALLEALGYNVERRTGKIAPTTATRTAGRRPPPLPSSGAITTEELGRTAHEATQQHRRGEITLDELTYIIEDARRRTQRSPPSGPPTSWPPSRTPSPGYPSPPPAAPQTRFSTRTPQLGSPPRQGEADPFGPQVHLTPQSSNVYSFSYYRRPAEKTGTLYVRFKAHRLNADSVSSGAGRLGGRRQLHGTSGSTVRGGDRPNLPGVLYAYYHVPPGVYLRMQQASSKGKFVWDNLRVRGTIYGHQYAYAAVQGQVTTDEVTPGIRGTYIPRRATKSGFKTRSIGDVGTGRRGFQSSTLPGQVGFSTRRR